MPAPLTVRSLWTEADLRAYVDHCFDNPVYRHRLRRSAIQWGFLVAAAVLATKLADAIPVDASDWLLVGSQVVFAGGMVGFGLLLWMRAGLRQQRNQYILRSRAELANWSDIAQFDPEFLTIGAAADRRYRWKLVTGVESLPSGLIVLTIDHREFYMPSGAFADTDARQKFLETVDAFRKGDPASANLSLAGWWTPSAASMGDGGIVARRE